MKKSEIYTLFAYINRYYANFGGDDEKVAAWYELLTDVPFDLGLANLKLYASTEPKWPPTVADLRKGKDTVTVFQNQLRHDAVQFIDELEQHCLTATQPPSNVKERMRELAERNSNRRHQHGAPAKEH
ncbi:replicative helicase loader/inhibitor [Paenibacillus sp. OV219]|uniref:replicative helicase loader/inhibitor n=1 Tax=Paenibacillus sp. OV219 TaxID=1884377 RepID=UPI0008B80FCA|nr:replicative helicase loader/inhibitor [Paenibacillus sp. OV219]SEM80832.1 Loader and inhibitor of phage G40P [Paenibacillus sp. OV219]